MASGLRNCGTAGLRVPDVQLFGCTIADVQRSGCMIPSVERRAVLDEPIERVWEAITDGSWLDKDVDIDVRPGGTGRIGDRSVLVTDVDPGRHISLLWWEGDDVSSVDFSLTPTDEGTELIVIERPTFQSSGPVASAQRAFAYA